MGLKDCLDHSARPHSLPWKASEDERRVVRELRRFTEPPLDGLTFVVRHFLPHLGRDNVWRILKAEGLNRLPRRAEGGKRKGCGTFKHYDLGFVHVDVKHLPKLRTKDGETCKRFLFVAIDRRSRSVHIAVKDEECEATAKAFLREVVEAFPFRITHVLAVAASPSRASSAPAPNSASRTAGPSPTRRRPTAWSSASTAASGRKVLCIIIHSHRALEELLRGFAPA